MLNVMGNPLCDLLTPPATPTLNSPAGLETGDTPAAFGFGVGADSVAGSGAGTGPGSWTGSSLAAGATLASGIGTSSDLAAKWGFGVGRKIERLSK